MSEVYQSEEATIDLAERFIYLTDNASPAIAEQFLKNAESSFNELARHPFMGSPLTLRKPMLADMRKWRIKKFDTVLIFYKPCTDGVLIVRVLHAAQDWWHIL